MIINVIFCSVLFSFLYQISTFSTLSIRRLFKRSQCDLCQKVLPLYRLIPVVSYILQCGRTHCCKQPLHYNYFVGELTAVVIGICLYHFDVILDDTTFLLLVLVLLTLAINDLVTLSIPLHIIVIAVICGVVLAPFYLPQFFIITFVLHCFFLLFKDAIGYGDILVFSYLSLFVPAPHLLHIFMITFILAGIIGLLHWLIHRNVQAKLPLIPFIFLALVITSFNIIPF